MKIGSGKLKIAAAIMCLGVIGGSFTYVNNHGYNSAMAKTISDIENEKAENDKKINELEDEIDDIEGNIEEAENEKKLLQEKIDTQQENLDIINDKIYELNNKIERSKEKISELKDDIHKKQSDIDEGKELFKQRLRAMYVSGNESMASALVGATDFYDALSKVELISQVAKYDDDLIQSLKTQLEQFEEAKTQLDVKSMELEEELEEQNACREEFNDAITELNEEYQRSESYIDEQQIKKQNASDNIEQYEADNAELDEQRAYIDEIARQQAQKASQSSAQREESRGSSGGGSSDSGSSDSGSSDDESGSSDNSGGSSSDSWDDNSGGGDYSYDGGALIWPVPGHYVISSGYGERWGSFHAGIDISDGNTMGATVVAAAGGTVTLAAGGCTHNYGKDYSCGCNGGYGNYIMIDHGNGMSTLYGHLGSIYVSQGQSVSAGEAIGEAGSTGWSTGAHLHFEVRVGGSTVDPSGYV